MSLEFHSCKSFYKQEYKDGKEKIELRKNKYVWKMGTSDLALTVCALYRPIIESCIHFSFMDMVRASKKKRIEPYTHNGSFSVRIQSVTIEE